MSFRGGMGGPNELPSNDQRENMSIVQGNQEPQKQTILKSLTMEWLTFVMT